jgi:desulfoferrodoxin (superoxide reductase-like protein)
MPTISMFYGIVVLMYYRDNVQHHLPHIHVRYQNDEVVINIENGDILTGNIPNKQMKLVQAWIEIHQEELKVNWELAVNGEEPFRINPLQ